MADFRRGLIAFAVVALLLVLGSSAYAQTCVGNLGGPATVRGEGVTELMGDIVIQCTGGTPTAVGAPVPQFNISILLSVNVTSRLFGVANLSEALLTIDEPGTAVLGGAAGTTPAATTLVGCVAVNSTNCSLTGTGTGGFGQGGPYLGTATRPNVFQGTWGGIGQPGAISWSGVPIDSPGTGNRIIRITNVRGNVSTLAVSSSLIPSSVTALITIQGLTLQQPQPTVAVVLPGLTASNKAITYQQCVNLNAKLVSSTATGGITDNGIAITATEGNLNPAAFKPRNTSQFTPPTNQLGVANTPATPTTSAAAPAAAGAQQLLGTSYYSESGFLATGTGGTASGTANFTVGTATASSPAFSPAGIGQADTGTELSFAFAGIPAGVQINVPTTIYLFPTATFTTTAAGAAVLAAVAPAAPVGATGVATLLSGASGGQLTIAAGAGTATYEVLLSAPSTQEFAYLNATVAFLANTSQNLPAPTGTTGATVAVNFAPISTVPTAATAVAPIPRFISAHAPGTLFNINACTCDLLFPFVTDVAGYDTGIAIANTTLDPFKTPLQNGNVTLNFYGLVTGSTTITTLTQTTTSPVVAGGELLFQLSAGGTNGTSAVPNFTGYLIAVAQFQFCHGFAFITQGLGTSSGIAEGYLAIQLDEPGWANLLTAPATGTRTGNVGESQSQ